MQKQNLGEETSIWMATTPPTNYPDLDQNMETNVVIIGGGIAGLMAAYFLKDTGLKVVVLERDRIASATTGFTTAKVTAQHGKIYNYLINKFGEDLAQIYADANSTAIEKIAEIIKELNIDCDFERLSAYFYTVDAEREKEISDEAAAAASLGLPASLENKVPLPYPTKSAVKFENQAKFHPRKFLLRMAKEIMSDGSFIFENTEVLEIKDGETCQTKTLKATIKSKKIVIATNRPIFDPDNFFDKLPTRQSFVLAGLIDKPNPYGVYYSSETGYSHSLRTQVADRKDLQIIGGKIFDRPDLSDKDQYTILAKWSEDNLGLNQINYHWTTSDIDSYDRVPIIGKISKNTKNLFVVTAFSGWGMTHSVVAGLILAKEVNGEQHPWSKLYSLDRFDNFKPDTSHINETENEEMDKPLNEKEFEKLGQGEAKVLNIDNKKIAAYKDRNDQIHAISAICTHMGCTVGWNKKEKTWDCPCHGSSYNFDGKVIHGPALKDLKKFE